MMTAPWTYEERPDTRTSNIRFGMWLFLASETMFFGSLVSAYVLLRTGSPSWPDTGVVLSAVSTVGQTGALASAALLVARSPWAAVAAGGVAVILQSFEHNRLWQAGVRPGGDLMGACWFMLTGVHLLHVVGGTIAAAWVAATSGRLAVAHAAGRRNALTRYWSFLIFVWLVILALFFFS
jgi:cytochrome c oxidase subunit 3